MRRRGCRSGCACCRQPSPSSREKLQGTREPLDIARLSEVYIFRKEEEERGGEGGGGRKGRERHAYVCRLAVKQHVITHGPLVLRVRLSDVHHQEARFVFVVFAHPVDKKHKMKGGRRGKEGAGERREEERYLLRSLTMALNGGQVYEPATTTTGREE